MAEHKRDVHGYTVMADDAVARGIDHLDYNLDYEEAKVIFEQARIHGSAQFEDNQDRNYTLKHNTDGTYTVTKRSASGWF